MDRQQMLARMKSFGVRIIKLNAALPKDAAGRTLASQILRSGTSIGANYHEACHASSKRHFITTMEIVQREARETLYWLELLAEAEVVPAHRLQPLCEECNELIAIITATIRTAKSRKT